MGIAAGGTDRRPAPPSSVLTRIDHSFIATVSRAESAKKLKKAFRELGGLGPTVQVRLGDDNVRSVAESDVILLW